MARETVKLGYRTPSMRPLLAYGPRPPFHPHTLRYATGFYLSNAGQDTRAIQLYLGQISEPSFPRNPPERFSLPGVCRQRAGRKRPKLRAVPKEGKA
jgi:hypothetical protein